MAIRSNHYEAAFEAYIRAIRVPCVAIDEAKRAIFGDDGVKNPDFLLYPRFSSNLVVEVKGKRGKNARGRRDWENWVTTDDLDGLVRWQAMFGPGFRSILAFVYAEIPQPFPLPKHNGAFEFRGLEYRFWAVGLDDYRRPSAVAGSGLEGGRDGPQGRFAAGFVRSKNGCRCRSMHPANPNLSRNVNDATQPRDPDSIGLLPVCSRWA